MAGDGCARFFVSFTDFCFSRHKIPLAVEPKKVYYNKRENGISQMFDEGGENNGDDRCGV